MRELVSGGAANVNNLMVIKAPIQGVFDCGFKAAGTRLDMKALCRYLSQPKYAATVSLIKECRQVCDIHRNSCVCDVIHRNSCVCVFVFVYL